VPARFLCAAVPSSLAVCSLLGLFSSSSVAAVRLARALRWLSAFTRLGALVPYCYRFRDFSSGYSDCPAVLRPTADSDFGKSPNTRKISYTFGRGLFSESLELLDSFNALSNRCHIRLSENWKFKQRPYNFKELITVSTLHGVSSFCTWITCTKNYCSGACHIVN